VRALFDQRMTDPTAPGVASALQAAVAAVNAKHKAGNLTALDGTSVVGERVAREPEGRYAIIGRYNADDVGRLVLAWWTNPSGRKLARIRGWREPDPRDESAAWGEGVLGAFHVAERDLAYRPPVWHVDPERLFQTHTESEPEWVAVCGCGAAGSPATLGWQHGMCGPCADRVAEFGAEAVTHEPGLLAGAGAAPVSVAFAPDGSVLAGGANWFCVWDATGAVQVGGKPEAEHFVPHMQVDPGGRFVLVSGAHSRLVFLDLAVSPPRRFSVGLFTAGRARWTGRPNELLLRTEGIGPFCSLDTTTGTFRRVEALEHYLDLLEVRPDPVSPRAVFADGHRVLIARLGRDQALMAEARFLLGDGHLNRTGVWQAGPEIVRFTPDGERLLFIRGTEMELRLPERPKALLQTTFPVAIRDAAFAPDYEHLYVLGADGAIYVCNPGTLTSIRARLRWHIGRVSRLAVSADGTALATAGAEGVKLWPVARLLPLLG
jgi:hypothetical protein